MKARFSGRKLVIVVLAVSLPLGASPGLEQDDRTEDPKERTRPAHEVTVTANRLETSLAETASSVSVISRQELERTGKVTVVEALSEVLGVSFTQNGPPGSAASVLIRGANGEHTKVMIDGMELNDPISPGRTFDMGLLLVEGVERIEVARGPQSTLYGSDAMGGVIHIITRQGQGPARLRFSASGGSYGTLTSNANVSGRTGKLSYAFGAAALLSRGFSAAATAYEGNAEADGSRNLNLSGKLGYSLGATVDLHLNVRTVRTRLELDSFGGDFGDDPNNLERYNAVALGGGARALLAGNRWESKLDASYLRYDRRYDNPVDDLHPFDSDESAYTSGLFKLDWQNNVFVHESNTLTAGLEYSRERGESAYASESAWGPYESVFPEAAANALGIYLQDRISLGDRFFATLGGRYDRHSRAGGTFTFRVAPGVSFPETGTRLKATLGTGFKSPSLYQLFAPATLYGPVGNAGLEPERSVAWDAGVEQEFLGGRLVLGALYYSNGFRNLIDYDSAQGFVNILEASAAGAELDLRARPSGSLELRAGYTLTGAKDGTTGEALLRRPRHKFSAALSSDWARKGRLSVEMIHLGRRDDLFWTGLAAERVTLAACTLLNALASYDLASGLQVFVRLDNILDADYELVKGYGTPGFSLYVGFRLGG